MTSDTWLHQKARMIDRFGERNFSKEFSLLVSLECRTMPDEPFVHMVNLMIGSRRPNDPPLLEDFRSGRLSYEKRKFEADLRGAANVMNGPARFEGLKAYLAKDFPGCKSLKEAVEVRKLQIKLQRLEDPSYEPMDDPKWMGSAP